jgi:plastocyanin
MKSKSTILIIILLAALFSGCVGGPQATPAPTTQPTTPAATPSGTATTSPSATPLSGVTPTGKSILVKLDSQRGFTPSTQTIQPGDEILFTNYDTVTVTLISSDGLFVAQTLPYYAGYRYVFNALGTYNFYLKENKNLTCTITVSQAISTPTPIPSGTPPLPLGFLYVQARMKKPAYWGPGNYSLQTVQAQITNQQTNPLSITAQIVSDGQVLEEKSFVLQQQGSGYGLTMDRQHYITSTNVTLRLLVQGYQPVEYPLQIVSSIG